MLRFSTASSVDDDIHDADQLVVAQVHHDPILEHAGKIWVALRFKVKLVYTLRSILKVKRSTKDQMAPVKPEEKTLHRNRLVTN